MIKVSNNVNAKQNGKMRTGINPFRLELGLLGHRVRSSTSLSFVYANCSWSSMRKQKFVIAALILDYTMCNFRQEPDEIDPVGKFLIFNGSPGALHIVSYYFEFNMIILCIFYSMILFP